MSSNVIQLFPSKEEQKTFVLTNQHINNYVTTIQDVCYLLSDLDVEDLESAIRVACFYAEQMQKRINELEDKDNE